jgi:hypothetical protein
MSMIEKMVLLDGSLSSVLRRYLLLFFFFFFLNVIGRHFFFLLLLVCRIKETTYNSLHFAPFFSSIA